MRQTTVLAVLLTSSAAVAQCVVAAGAPISVNQDDINGPHLIGFNFPFGGSTYNEIHVSDHGICFLTDNGQPALPAAFPLVFTPQSASLVANGPVICPFWSDTIPGAAGDVYIDSQATVCTITWDRVESFGLPSNVMSFQLKLFDSGNLEFVYGPDVTNDSTYASPSDHAVVGVSPGSPATVPLAVDFSSGPVTTDPTTFDEFLVAGGFDLANDTILMIPSAPGWSVIHTAGGAGCATTESYGQGCHGLMLQSTTAPVLGSGWELTSAGIDPISAVCVHYFAVGREDPPVPVTMFGYQAPGCDIHIPLSSILTTVVGGVVNGESTVTPAVPADPSFIGVRLNAQSIAFSAANAAGFALSNGESGLFGN